MLKNIWPAIFLIGCKCRPIVSIAKYRVAFFYILLIDCTFLWCFVTKMIPQRRTVPYIVCNSCILTDASQLGSQNHIFNKRIRPLNLEQHLPMPPVAVVNIHGCERLQKLALGNGYFPLVNIGFHRVNGLFLLEKNRQFILFIFFLS